MQPADAAMQVPAVSSATGGKLHHPTEPDVRRRARGGDACEFGCCCETKFKLNMFGKETTSPSSAEDLSPNFPKVMLERLEWAPTANNKTTWTE